MTTSNVSSVKCAYDEGNYSFTLQQLGYPAFVVPEGYLQRLVDVFLEPSEYELSESLWNTFRVTEAEQSLILERSSKGKSVLLMKLSKSAAKQLAEKIESIHGSVIRSYTW